jgi:hypothetical protein
MAWRDLAQRGGVYLTLGKLGAGTTCMKRTPGRWMNR